MIPITMTYVSINGHCSTFILQVLHKVLISVGYDDVISLYLNGG